MPSGRCQFCSIWAAVCGLILLASNLPTDVSAAVTWTVDLPESLELPARPVTLKDLATGPVPEPAGGIVMGGAGHPGSQQVITRRLVLRRLVEAQLADGVRFTGATSCRVTHGGQPLAKSEVSAAILDLLTEWLPEWDSAAPPSRCEISLPGGDLAVTENWRVELIRPGPLQPGRNLIGVKLVDGQRSTRLNVTAICHIFGLIPRARQDIAQGTVLQQASIQWEWTDLAQLPNGVVCGQEALAGQSARREVSAGAVLRQSDLRETPLIRRGERIDLKISRLGVTVTVRATARQDGCRGKIITVRNELNGELTTGRVTGPGLVEWGR